MKACKRPNGNVLQCIAQLVVTCHALVTVLLEWLCIPNLEMTSYIVHVDNTVDLSLVIDWEFKLGIGI